MADQTNQKKDMDKIVKYTVKPLITNTSEEFIKFYICNITLSESEEYDI